MNHKEDLSSSPPLHAAQSAHLHPGITPLQHQPTSPSCSSAQPHYAFLTMNAHQQQPSPPPSHTLHPPSQTTPIAGAVIREPNWKTRFNPNRKQPSRLQLPKRIIPLQTNLFTCSTCKTIFYAADAEKSIRETHSFLPHLMAIKHAHFWHFIQKWGLEKQDCCNQPCCQTCRFCLYGFFDHIIKSILPSRREEERKKVDLFGDGLMANTHGRRNTIGAINLVARPIDSVYTGRSYHNKHLKDLAEAKKEKKKVDLLRDSLASSSGEDK